MAPWKDKTKNNKASSEYGKKNYKRLTLCIRIDSGIPDALDLMERLTGMPQPIYAKNALLEQLQKDGYLDEKMTKIDEQALLEFIGKI